MRDCLYKMNPLSKLIIMGILAVFVTCSQDIYFPSAVLLVLIISGYFSKITLLDFWRAMKVAVIGALCLCIFILLSKSVKDGGDFQIGAFGLYTYEIEQAASLALRMLGFAYAGYLFSKTTDPVIFVLNLIKYWKVPVPAGYAFLTAYRFVPTFQSEFQKIRLAHEVRGMKQSFKWLRSVVQLPIYLFPLMIQAIRTGERVSIAMEARSFGLKEAKTYYKTVQMTHYDTQAVLISLVALSAMAILFVKLGVFKFGLGF
ncbi:MAG: energy-coupling factor transporter transmembrane protein EcfT [Enterococcaceae bacterium]|nr:energy-coupling factor transporter transmembrane protein EcfT [Enterococcaceae bacterium]